MNQAQKKLNTNISIERLLCIFALVAVLWLPASPATAQNNINTYYTWRVHVIFKDSQIYAQWILSKVDEDSLTNAVLDVEDLITRDISKTCDVVGHVQLMAGHASFDGGYVQCELPNFQKEVDNLLGKGTFCECKLKHLFWAAAQFKAKNITAGAQPLISIDGMSYQVSPSARGKGMQTELLIGNTTAPGQWQVTIASDVANTIENAFSGLGADILVARPDFDTQFEFFATDDFVISANNIGPGNYLAWIEQDNPISGSPQWTGGVNVGPNPNALYIGYDSATGTHFQGLIEEVMGDPGCGRH